MAHLNAMRLRSSPLPEIPPPVVPQPSFNFVNPFDPFGIGKIFVRAQVAWLEHPIDLGTAMGRFYCGMQGLFLHACNKAVGVEQDERVSVASADERFTDPEWHDNPFFSSLTQFYLFYTRWLDQTLYDTPGLTKKDRRTAAFWARQWLNALAPSNYLLTNPIAQKKLIESGGTTLIKGIERWADDLKANDLQMVDGVAFSVGKNLATTPGAVIFRNELVEVIQYTPTREKVHAVPIVIIAPWINKFYILDLNPKKSMIRYLLDQGFSVFVTSWKNPTAEMAHTTFDDYMLKGVLATIEAARAVCGVPQVHAVGYCIGGTALAALMAWLNKEYQGRREKIPVAHWTLLASLVDFSRPGEIEAFINDDAVAAIENIMLTKGYLDSKELSISFRMLRPNSLIWHYFVHKYLYGESAPAFDVLFWNMDGTRMPYAMHSFYLRNFYLENKLAKQNGVVLGNHAIDFSLVDQPLYIVGTREDHIAPWRGTFHICNLIRSPVRYTLSTSGHILGIINPPVSPPKREYWAGDASQVVEAKAWREKLAKKEGSWWDDWVPWLRTHCGPMSSPPSLGSASHPVLGTAPGKYVYEV